MKFNRKNITIPVRPSAVRLAFFFFLYSLICLVQTGSVRAGDLVVDLGLNQQNVTVLGDQANAYLGNAVSSADFNHDGYADLLIGAGDDDHNGNVSGAAFMVLGGAQLPATFDLASTAANLTVYGAQFGDALGHAVAAGDVNGDGYADMIIGADGWSNGEKRGAVYVVLGGPGLFTTPQVIDLAVSGTAADVTILGGAAGDQFGRAVAVGDINGDGIDDILVGAFNASPGGRSQAGAVYVILGSTAFVRGTPVTLDMSSQAAALTIYGGAGAPGGSSEIGDRLGRAVASGDINGDGIGDLILGAPGVNVGDTLDAGATYVFYGSNAYSSGATVFDLSADPGVASVTLNGIDAGDQSGLAVGSGDLNGDGVGDILIGAYLAQGPDNTASDTGEVYAVYGGASLPGTIPLNTGADITVYGAAAGDRLGFSLAATDLNQDGFADLILGAPRAAPDGRQDAGAAYVVDGQANLPSPILLSDPSASAIQVWGAGGSGVVCDPPFNKNTDCSDEVGSTVAGADINGDGVADLIVGAQYANNAGLQDAGAVYAIYGTASHGAAVAITIAPDPLFTGTGEMVSYSATARDAQNNTWDVTPETLFSIDAGAGGSWSGNVYTAQNAGTWTVTGTYLGFNDTAKLIVSANPRYMFLPLIDNR